MALRTIGLWLGAWVVLAMYDLTIAQDSTCPATVEILESIDARSDPALFTLDGEIYMAGGGGTFDQIVWNLQPDGRWIGVGIDAAPSSHFEAVEHEGEGLVYAVTDEGYTYTWDGAMWTRLAVTPPEFVDALVYDSLRERVLLSGEGYSGGGGLYELDRATGQWVMIGNNLPGLGGGHDMVYDRDRDTVVLFGGYQEEYYCDDISLNVLWEFDLSAGHWRQVPESGEWPSSRYGHGMYYDQSRGVTVVSSGESRRDRCTACLVHYYPRLDIWEWDGVEWQPAGLAPGDVGNSVVYDVANERGVLIGGGRFRRNSDTCELEAQYFDHNMERTDHSWTELSPSVRPITAAKHRVAYHPGRSGIIAHGGELAISFEPFYETSDASFLYNRRGRYSFVASGYRADSVGMAYDGVRGHLVGFGGMADRSTLLGHTYSLGAFGDWQRLFPATQPSARESHALAWHPELERIVLFGGSRAVMDDRRAWVWDGQDWTAYPELGPSSPGFTAMAYEPASNAMLVVVTGGSTWRFDPAASSGRAWHNTGAHLLMDNPRIEFIPGYGIVAASRDSASPTMYRWGSGLSQWTLIGDRPPGYVTDFTYDPVLGAVVFSSAFSRQFVHWYPPCPADLDCDGTTTIFDFLAFQTAFEASDPKADIDGDGAFTVFDYLAFIDIFDDGCD